MIHLYNIIERIFSILDDNKLITIVIIFLGIIIIIFGIAAYYMLQPSRISQNLDKILSENSITLDDTYYERISYAVVNHEWREIINTRLERKKPDSKFFIIRIVIKNINNEPIKIPTFYLIDEYNNKYIHCNDRFDSSISEQIELLNEDYKLNPNVYRVGCLIFDVPSNNKYYLILSTSKSEKILIE